MGANLYRYKGLLAVAGDKRKFVFQGVGMLFSGAFSNQVWRHDEKKECRFVFIGKDLDKDFLKDGFMACQCTENLRFKVGDKVYANVGEWTEGRIIKLWDEGSLIALSSRMATKPMSTGQWIQTSTCEQIACPIPIRSQIQEVQTLREHCVWCVRNIHSCCK